MAQSTMSIETVAELAARWKVSRAHIYNLMSRGLPSVSLGRCRRFRSDEVDAWLASNSAEAPAGL